MPCLPPTLLLLVLASLLAGVVTAAQVPAVRAPDVHDNNFGAATLPARSRRIIPLGAEAPYRRRATDLPALPARFERSRARRALPVPLRLPPGHRDTAAVVPSRGAAAARRLASRLLRTAASHKDRSLRDVLDDNVPAEPKRRVRTTKLLFDPSSEDVSDARREYHATDDKLARRAARTQQSGHEHDADAQPADAMLAGLAARLYPADANESDSGAMRQRSLSLTLDDEDYFEGEAPERRDASHSERVYTSADTGSMGGTQTVSNDDATDESSEQRLGGVPPRAERMALERALVSLRAAQGAKSPTRAAAALRTIQELCHSLHHGAALAASDGLSAVLHGLDDRTRPVRAAAAWAVATCAQNNPTVQRAALSGGALPKLARLVLRHDDGDTMDGRRVMIGRRGVVRGRALFAINALLGCERARREFEQMPEAGAVVARGLGDMGDVRAMRRALNVAEVLVRRDARKWRAVLERSEVSAMIERLMREHDDIDVRESAARIVAALDGRVVVG